MFRAEIQWLEVGPTLKLQGELAEDWAAQARSLVTQEILPRGLIVDITNLSHIDSAGEQLLKWLASTGALFLARSFYANALCDRLGLSPLQMSGRGRRRHGSDEESPSRKASFLVEVS